MAPFASDYTDHELVVAVREVTLHVNPRKPKTVSLRGFDDGRAPTPGTQMLRVRRRSASGST